MEKLKLAPMAPLQIRVLAFEFQKLISVTLYFIELTQIWNNCH